MKKILFISLFAAGLKLSAQVFSTPVVMESPNATGGMAGEYSSHLVVNGNPAIAYYDRVHADLMFVRALDPSGMTWGTPVLVDNHYDAGSYCSVKIVNGFPAIAYIEETYRRVMYVRALDANGTAWGTPVIIEDIPANHPAFTSLEIINGSPAIAYTDWNTNFVRYVRAQDNNGNTWNAPQTIGTGVLEITLVNLNGRPALTYFSLSGINFQRANDADGISWASPVLITSDYGIELTCTVWSGKPAVAYHDQSTGSLKFARSLDSTGIAWSASIPLDPGNDEHQPSMVYDGSRFMITYGNFSVEGIKFVRSLDSSGTSWTAPMYVNNPGEGFWESSLEIVSGIPAFSCWGGQQPLYIRAGDQLGNSWNPPIYLYSPPESGKNLSMCVVDGRPAVASIRDSEIPRMIMYNISTDETGQNWNTADGLQIGILPNSNASLASINHAPAIAVSRVNSIIKIGYLRSLDSVGSSWATIVSVDSTSNASNCKLLDLNGTPAIVYFDSTAGTIKFTHALNGNGTSWAPAVSSFWFSSMRYSAAVINGKPANAYANSGNNSLMYSIALDSLGNSWTIPIPIAPALGTNSTPSIANIDGFPAVAYAEPNSTVLAYIRAVDSVGSTWSSPMFPSGTATAGNDPTLIEHDGRPVISYMGSLNERMFIASNDRTGMTWSQEVFLDSTRAPVVFIASDAISVNGYVGVGYDERSDKYGYYTTSCIPPFNPVASSSSASICSGDNTTLNSSGYGTLSWYTSATGGTYVGSGSAFNTGALSNTTTFYVQDSTCGASTRTAVTVTVNPLPTLTLSGNTNICSGDNTQLTASGNGAGFSWSTGDTTLTATFSPASSTNYFVSTYDGNGCVDTIFFTVSVTQPQTTTQTIALCPGDSYTVGTNTYNAAGTYTDSLATLLLGCDSIVVTTITIQPAIDTTVNYSAGVLSSNESGATYQWINCTTQQPVNGATNQNFTPTVNGTYAVAIVNGPCSDTSICYTVTDVGVDDIIANASSLAVYSASGQINAVVQTGKGVVCYEFFNALGELVYTASAPAGEAVSYVCASSGMYIVKAGSNGTSMVKRVVVE